MRQLEISLFGGLNITLNSERLSGVHSDKVRELLTYLAVESDPAHSRNWLAILLWPSWTEDDEQAEAPFLLVSRQTIQFNTAFTYI